MLGGAKLQSLWPDIFVGEIILSLAAFSRLRLGFLLALVACHSATPDHLLDSNVASATDIQDLVTHLAKDGQLDIADVKSILSTAGERLKAPEGLVIFASLRRPQGYSVAPDALQWAENHALNRDLSGNERDFLAAKKSFAGTPLPDSVLKVLTDARLAGAVAYDVTEVDPDKPDDGFWSPYPQELPILNNMVFSFTEITPRALAEDMSSTRLEDVKNGETNSVITYRQDQCLGKRGNIVAEYDEAQHPNIYARGSSCQKWANNCGILSDGTLHCLPASRRISADADFAQLILTNPSLARGRRMLFNGHIEARNGIIVSVGMSGRIAKRAARNEYAFIDPVPLLKAWGFQLAPALKTKSEHSSTAQQLTSHTESNTLRGPVP